MAELPIAFHNRLAKPEAPARPDHYQWRIWLEDDDQRFSLLVELSGEDARRTGLGTSDLDARVEAALQRYAAGILHDDLPAYDQATGWSVPIVLHAEHFA
jgi:hypothetical protein